MRLFLASVLLCLVGSLTDARVPGQQHGGPVVPAPAGRSTGGSEVKAAVGASNDTKVSSIRNRSPTEKVAPAATLAPEKDPGAPATVTVGDLSATRGEKDTAQPDADAPADGEYDEADGHADAADAAPTAASIPSPTKFCNRTDANLDTQAPPMGNSVDKEWVGKIYIISLSQLDSSCPSERSCPGGAALQEVCEAKHNNFRCDAAWGSGMVGSYRTGMDNNDRTIEKAISQISRKWCLECAETLSILTIRDAPLSLPQTGGGGGGFV